MVKAKDKDEKLKKLTVKNEDKQKSNKLLPNNRKRHGTKTAKIICRQYTKIIWKNYMLR